MSRHRNNRVAFTLVELLVVIAIIGTLMGLLLPAVQSAREAGRRSSCSNNLKQLALGFTAYDGKKHALPGWRNNHPSGALAGVSWVVPLLPHLERSDLYRGWEQGANDVANINLLLCPSSPLDSDGAGVTNYAANCGTSRCNGQNQIKGDGVLYDSFGNAPMYTPARTSLDVITAADGTTNTLLVSEKCNSLVPTPLSWGSVLVPLDASNSTMVTSVQNGSISIIPAYQGAPVIGVNLAAAGFSSSKVLNSLENSAIDVHPSSNHTGGVMAAFCDGRVIFLKDTVSASVYAQLLSSDSRWEIITAPDVWGYKTNSAFFRTWVPNKTLLSESDY